MSPQVTPAVMAASKKERVAVFFDYENVHRTGHSQYSQYGTPVHETVFDPSELAERICAKRNRPSELVSVRVYRGRPVPQHQPVPTSAFDMQVNAWTKDPRVAIISRALKYDFPYDDPTQFLAQEKGIDVSLAIDLVEAAMKGSYDAMVVFSSDTDLLPALELVRKIHNVHIEIACWSEGNPLWLREGLSQDPPVHFPYCHFMKGEDFLGARDTTAYNMTLSNP